jgi:hypothetical protein
MLDIFDRKNSLRCFSALRREIRGTHFEVSFFASKMESEESIDDLEIYRACPYPV